MKTAETERTTGALQGLSVQGLTAGYGGRLVVVDVTFAAPKGSVTLMVGPNGSGKSTVLRTLVGLLPRSEGRVQWCNHSFDSNVAVLRRNGVAYMPQRRPIFQTLSVKANLDLAVQFLERSERKRRIDEMLSDFPALGERLRLSASVLSGGERQQLGMACALALSPRLLLADEPTAGIAPEQRRFLLEHLRKQASEHGTTVILVEHNVRNAARVSDHVVGLRLGRKVVECRASDFGEEAQRKVFLT